MGFGSAAAGAHLNLSPMTRLITMVGDGVCEFTARPQRALPERRTPAQAYTALPDTHPHSHRTSAKPATNSSPATTSTPTTTTGPINRKTPADGRGIC